MTRFVHLTDLHISHPEAQGAAPQSDTAATLARAVAAIGAMDPPPAFVVASGDLANHGDPASYRLLRALLEPLKMPVLLALGNHDARPAFHAEFGDGASDRPHCHEQLLSGLHVIVLDTGIPGRVPGTICAPQFGYLEAALQRHAGVPKLLVMHHPPRLDADTLPWASLDQAATDRLAAVVAGHPVAGILSGHIHMNRVSHWHGIPVLINVGMLSTVDLLEPADMRILEGAGFGICTLRASGLTVTCVPLAPAAQQLGFIDVARLRSFT